MSFPPPALAALDAAEEVEESMFDGTEFVVPVHEFVSPALAVDVEESES